MPRYALAYRLGITPWERYLQTAAASIAALLDREEAERPRPPGRALDLGCGRGEYTAELARRGWDVVGVDNVPLGIEAANRKAIAGATFRVADVTMLEPDELGSFDFFLDVGCFQHLDRDQRRAEGRGAAAMANERATLLVLAFGSTPLRSAVGGVSEADVRDAFAAGWDLVDVQPADTAGLGWPMSRTSPQWYRLRRQS